MKSGVEPVEPIESAPALTLAVELFRALNVGGVRYCQWKSTPGLPRALQGKTDFDLLVDRRDGRLFREVLDLLDFKPLSSRGGQFPAVEHYLGMDQRTGQLIHLHVYYRLVLGEEYVKNHDLPLVQAFLANTELRGDVKVPVPELEVVVLALRALLKYRDRDLVKDLLRRHSSPGLPRGILEELKWLLPRTDASRLADVLKREVGFVSPGLIFEFLTTVRESPRAGWTLYRLRQQARRELASFQRHGVLRAQPAYYRGVLSQERPFKRLLGALGNAEDRSKTPAAGGLTVAFIGPDGSGKSTLVQQVGKWLSWKLDVRVSYMGIPKSSLLTSSARAISTLGGLAYAGCRRLAGEKSPVTRLAGVAKELGTALYRLSLGFERRRRHYAAHKQAAQGAVVILDRYPLRPVGPGDHPMDGPRLAAAGAGHLGALGRKLAELESRLYEQIRPADHYFVLHISPDAALQRKPDHRLAALQARHQAIEALDAHGLTVTHVDASQPLDQVLLQVKSALWERL